MFWDKDGIMLMIVLLIIAPYAIVAIAEWLWSYAKKEKHFPDASQDFCAD